MPIADMVTIDASQFPETLRAELLDALRTREVPPKFHYESHKQAQRWLALHEAHSPARRDPDTVGLYERAFSAAVARVKEDGARVVGLGCGGGQKEARLLEMLAQRGAPVSYLPCDASVPLVLTALHAAEAVVPGLCGDPLVCDVARCRSLAESIDRVGGQMGLPGRRLFTFFGMTPNLEPETAGAILGSLAQPEDWLLLSANLAPGMDYGAGVRRILAGYDNALTRAWLLEFLLDLGVERGDGQIRFAIEDAPSNYKRIVADFYFDRRREIEIYRERFVFQTGERIRLFFSYRFTPAQIDALLTRHGLKIEGQWVASSGEEGVFLCRKAAAA